MKISGTLLRNDYPLKYFYCVIDNKEFIFVGDKSGIVDSSIYNGEIGEIIINIFDHKDEIISTIEEHIKNIKNLQMNDDELHNQDVIWKSLVDLQGKLETLNIKYFRFFDIADDLSERFVEEYNEFNKENIIYSQEMDFLNLIKDNGYDVLDDSNLERLIERQKEKVNEFKNLTFKNFVIDNLIKYIEDLIFFYTCFNLYIFQNYDWNITNDKEGNEEINNPLFKVNILQKNINLINDSGENKCYFKLVLYNDKKIYIDNENAKEENIENAKISFVRFFEINDVVKLLNLSLGTVIEKNIKINMCFNCNKYFTPKSRSDEKYCDRISPQNPKRTCKEFGAKKKYREEIKSNLIKSEHNRTSQFYRMRMKRTLNQKEKEKIENRYKKYKQDFEKQKAKYNKKKLDEDSFVEWIINQKELN